METCEMSKKNDNATATTTEEAAAENWLVVIPEIKTPAELFEDDAMITSVLDRVEELAWAHEPDLSTDKGRKAVASQAYKVARTKTGLDEAGKALTADWKVRIGLIDANRKRIRERLDKLRDDVRRPLTEWEEEDAARVAQHQAALETVRELGNRNLIRRPDQMTLPKLNQTLARLDQLRNLDWQEFADEADKAIDQSEAEVSMAIDVVKEAAARAEAKRLADEERKKLEAEREAMLAEMRRAEDVRQKKAAEEQATIRAEREALAAERRELEKARAELDRAKAGPAAILNNMPAIAAVVPKVIPAFTEVVSEAMRELTVPISNTFTDSLGPIVPLTEKWAKAPDDQIVTIVAAEPISGENTATVDMRLAMRRLIAATEPIVKAAKLWPLPEHMTLDADTALANARKALRS